MVAHLCEAVAWLSDGVKPATPADALKRIGLHRLPCQHGDMLEVPGVPDVVVEVLPAFHGETVSHRYGFNEVRHHKLKQEYPWALWE